MTIVTNEDARGVDALRGGEPLLPEVIWFQIVNELGPLPEAPHIEPFHDGPWRELPEIGELAYLWLESPITQIIHDMAVAAHGGGSDFMQFMATQRFIAQIEVDLRKEREALDAEAGTVDDRAVGEDAGVGVVEAGGGGLDVSGGSEDSNSVGEEQEAVGDPDDRRPQKVPRGRRTGKAA